MWYSRRTGSAGGDRGRPPVVARASDGGAGHGQAWTPGNPADLQLELASQVVVAFILQGDGVTRVCKWYVITVGLSRDVCVACSGRLWALNEKQCSSL